MLRGEKLGRYEILRLIGTGGMGEVYLAKDKQLGRQVALKILLPEFKVDKNRVKRFMYEARAVSALNHPGIITIHEIDKVGSELFIATEFVDGETLRDKIERQELDLFASVGLAEQIADALAAAHRENIIHRDIKPENIMVRKDGIAKVLDFGLAKPLYSFESDSEHQDILVKTLPGLVIGSVRYMSPEQARGMETDGRTDIWSLGVVLYEMLTGKTPFDGKTVSDQLAALIHAEPEPLTEISPELDTIVGKCLCKDRDQRYQSMEQVASALRQFRQLNSIAGSSRSGEMVKTAAMPLHSTSENATLIHRTLSSDSTATVDEKQIPASGSKAKSRTGYVAAVALTTFILLGVAGWFLIPAFLNQAGPSFDSIRVSRLTDNGNARRASISPDGKLVVFASKQGAASRLSVRQVGTGTEFEIVPETVGEFAQPGFSPDGNFIYFVLISNGVGTLSKVPSLGGDVVELQKDVDTRAVVSPDGKKLAFSRHDPNRGGDKVFTIDSDGKNLQFFTDTSKIGFEHISDLFWSSDGLLLNIAGHRADQYSTRMTSIVSVEVKGGKVVENWANKLFEEFKWTPAFGFQTMANDVGLLFVGRRAADEAIQVWYIDNNQETVRAVTTDTSDYEAVAASFDGKTVVATKSDWNTRMISYDASGKKSTEIGPESRKTFGRRISQTSEGQLLVSARDGREMNIYAIDPESGDETRLTSGSGFNLDPVVSQSDHTIVFVSNRGDSYGLWKMEPNGVRPEQLTQPTGAIDTEPVFINGGRTIVFIRKMTNGGLSKLMKLPIEGGEPKELLEMNSSSVFSPRVSSDGKLLAFVTVEFQVEEPLIVSTIRIADIDGEKIKVRDGGISLNNESTFSWSPSGNRLTVVRSDSSDDIVEVALNGNSERPLTKVESGLIKGFAWSNDGSRLYMINGTPRNDLVLITYEDV